MEFVKTTDKGVIFNVNGRPFFIANAVYRPNPDKVKKGLDLKQCPYCKYDNVILIECDDSFKHVFCPECGTTGPKKDSYDEAVKAWNKLCCRR